MHCVRLQILVAICIVVAAGCGGNKSQPAGPVAAPESAGEAQAAASNDELVAKMDDLHRARPQAASREEFFQQLTANQRQVLELGQRVLANNPEPAQRDHVRGVSLSAIAVLSQTDPSQRELLGRVDRLTEEVLAEKSEGPDAASAELVRAFVHLNIDGPAAEDNAEVARRLVAMVADVHAKYPDEERSKILSNRVEMIEGKQRLRESMGKPLEIAGPTLGHGDLDIKQYKGKVVLVDFWATWCGPCLAELPNVRAVYDKYRDSGFDVIGVSLDRGLNELADFVKQEGLPWAQVFFDEEGKRFWDNPLVRKYGIDGIPATFLMDRAGALREIGVRGQQLETAVAKLISEPAPTDSKEE